MTYRNQFHGHLADVETLAAHGVPAPREWAAVRENFAGFIELAHPISDKLAAEILEPSGADVAVLRALALAEQAATSVDDAAVTDVVRTRVHGRLVALYEPHAQRNYKQVAAQFDDIAAQFAKCVRAVDPEIGSDAVVGAGDAARRAWFDAAELAAALDEWLRVLTAAGRLAGVPAADDTEIAISLAVDTGKIHRRKLWTAWHATGTRCGRWSALLALGAELRAHKHPARLAPYSAPRPFQVRWVPGPHGGHVQQVTDPEDDPRAAAPAEEWSIA